ncbi:hypothetical protein [Streptomyces sp. DB-54]
MGLELPPLVHQLATDERDWPLWVAAVAFTVLAIRLLRAFPLSALMRYRRGARDHHVYGVPRTGTFGMAAPVHPGPCTVRNPIDPLPVITPTACMARC